MGDPNCNYCGGTGPSGADTCTHCIAYDERQKRDRRERFRELESLWLRIDYDRAHEVLGKLDTVSWNTVPAWAVVAVVMLKKKGLVAQDPRSGTYLTGAGRELLRWGEQYGR